MERGAGPRAGLTDLDPRVKLGIMLLVGMTTFTAPDSFVLVCNYILIVFLWAAIGETAGAVKLSVFYLMVSGLDHGAGLMPDGAFKAFTGLVLFFLTRAASFMIMGAWFARKTPLGNFVYAMQALGIPKGITISLAVVIRYIPTVQCEFKRIMDTMRLRGCGPDLNNLVRHPVRTLEYALVPLLMRSLVIAEELSASAVTRGLDLTGRRTCHAKVKITRKDMLTGLAVILYLGLAATLTPGQPS